MRLTGTLKALTVLSACILPALTNISFAADAPPCRHAVSLIGTPKMPADYKHFDWVNPDAPKGGVLRLSENGSFDSLNGFTINGSAAEGLGLLYDTLFLDSPDEPSTEYGLIAECVSFPDDFSYAKFKLRPEAKFQDGTPVRPEDVVASLSLLKAASPQMALYYKNITSAAKTGDSEVTFTFDKSGNRELPLITSQLPILPEHYWSGKNGAGEPRDISKSSMEKPFGSGPYQIKTFEPGRNIVYERVANYWAKELPVSKGQWNFDQIRYEYFRDRLPAFEAFKTGIVDSWQESMSSAWATQYDIDAVKNGLIKKELLPHTRVAGMQAFAFNLRRKQFSDPRVRRAFNLALDFEELNRKIFFGAYTRLSSYFDNSELKAKGLPDGKELEILNEVKAEVPAEVFTTEWKNPENAAADDARTHLRDALTLLQSAGWTLKGGTLTNAAGEKLDAEFLLVQPEFERVVLPYAENLKKIGINASVRIVDSSQYERRAKSFDYDIIINSVGQSHSPGNEQRYYFGSASADKEGSRNVGGIKNPAVDKLIDKIVFAKDRDELVAATRALDRVLLWNFYVVPQWHLPAARIASWDVFGRPEKLPSQDPTRVTQTWWIDPVKAKAVEAARAK
jgi:microcin C transport system substrate-binding protein